jgi:glycosidase
MPPRRYPALYEINTRIWLHELGRAAGRPTTLADVPDAALDQIAGLGFDWVWLLGVWQTGQAGRQVSLTQPGWRQGYQQLLPDFTDDDVCGSPYAVQGYWVHADFGGDDALLVLRRRLHERGLRLMLDFVPNHTALDHRWVSEWPDFYVQGTPADLDQAPLSYWRATTKHGPAVLAHGRDPNWPAWPDTLQLNYRHPVLREAMTEELTQVAGLCDGVRCDMAMLILPEVFARTWGNRALPGGGLAPADRPFWPEAIARVHCHYPGFLFLAEAYWDLEWTLQQQGFDYTYDKLLYDRLRAGNPEGVRAHLGADLSFQAKSARFLENHDEPRAASVFSMPLHAAAAALTYLAPGLRFMHEGQLEGRRKHASIHLCRRSDEAPDPEIQGFYRRLLECLRRPELRDGRWRLLECRPGWAGSATWQQLLAYSWEEAGGGRLVVTVNYGPTAGQCYIRLPWTDLGGRQWLLCDQLSPGRYERVGDDLAANGLYLDLSAWGCHVFEMSSV